MKSRNLKSFAHKFRNLKSRKLKGLAHNSEIWKAETWKILRINSETWKAETWKAETWKVIRINQKFENTNLKSFTQKFRNLKSRNLKSFCAEIQKRENRMEILPAVNSSYKKWRIKCKIHVYLSQEIFILAENMQFRSSPLLVAAGR